MAKKSAATQDPAKSSCPECGHRSVEHILGNEPCNMPGCPCSVGK